MQVDDFVYISDGAYTKQQLLAMVINHFHLHFNEQQCFPIIIPFLSFNLLIEAKLEPKVFLLSPCSYRHFTALDTQPISAQHFCISKCRNEQYWTPSSSTWRFQLRMCLWCGSWKLRMLMKRWAYYHLLGFLAVLLRVHASNPQRGKLKSWCLRFSDPIISIRIALRQWYDTSSNTAHDHIVLGSLRWVHIRVRVQETWSPKYPLVDLAIELKIGPSQNWFSQTRSIFLSRDRWDLEAKWCHITAISYLESRPRIQNHALGL